MELLNQLRSRPEGERFSIAVLAAGAVAVILFLIWGVTFFSRDIQNESITVVQDQQAAAVTESIDAFTQEIETTREAFSGQYEQLRRALVEEGFIPPEGAPQGGAYEISVGEDGTINVNTLDREPQE